MRRFIRIVLMVLALILVALVSALATMDFAIHGREVKVPKLVGMRPSIAAETLAGNGLLLENDDKFYSETISAGEVVSQSPREGTKVRRGWHVKVAISLGPPLSAVPDVLGQSSRAGEINVQRRGLELGTVATVHLPGLPADQVVAESPPPNSEVVSPKVDLLVTAPESDQSYVMPNFSGETVAAAARAIAAAGMRLGNFAPNPGGAWRESDAAPQPQIPDNVVNAPVTGQSPAAGQKVSPGTVVVLQWKSAS
jgi:beta-lactam-binding protein with PASTA domain